PAIRNAWLDVHITLVLLGFAALAFTAGASLLYLFQERELKRKKPRKLYYRLPPLGLLDELISRSMALGFVLMTLAVIAATTWTFIEHKTQWISQPAIAISFITWGCYLAMLFVRVTAGWRGRKAAIMVIVVVGLSAITWAAHARLGHLLLKP
ncbi:MAG TPA: cytochrome c biogenesis protein CcsA, partial [Bryobacteraceae bacterium]|nr:cytochrome c biogenesis protein CcsA [Bryobacteraceae bacterium]